MVDVPSEPFDPALFAVPAWFVDAGVNRLVSEWPRLDAESLYPRRVETVVLGGWVAEVDHLVVVVVDLDDEITQQAEIYMEQQRTLLLNERCCSMYVSAS